MQEVSVLIREVGPVTVYTNGVSAVFIEYHII